MTDQVRIDVHERSGVVVLVVSGEVDISSVALLQDAVATALTAPSGTPVVIDLTAVAFFSAAGLAALVEAHRNARREGQPLRVVVDHNKPVIKPMEVTAVAAALALYGTVEDAVLGRTPDSPAGERLSNGATAHPPVR